MAMDTVFYIVSIVLFSIALINMVNIIKSLYTAIKVFKKIKSNPDKEEVSLNIPFKVYYGLFADILLMVFLVFYWIN